MTSLDLTKKASSWQPPVDIVDYPVPNDIKRGQKKGMMLYSFSQDIESFTQLPQHSIHYPSKGDHRWQKTIAETMWNQK
jgi:hypothetical protein